MKSISSPTLATRLISLVSSRKPSTTRRVYAERDFGVGYGRSSGYASPRQYANGWNGQPRFRCG